MAELTKKLYIKNTSGTTQTIKLHSTTAEANASGSGVLNLKVDNVNCYAGLGSTSNSYATSGRVKNSSGTTLAILSQGGITAGSRTVACDGTFTVPTGVKILKAQCTCNGNTATQYVKVTSGKTILVTEDVNEYEEDSGESVFYWENYDPYISCGNKNCYFFGEAQDIARNPVTFSWSNDINAYTGTTTDLTT